MFGLKRRRLKWNYCQRKCLRSLALIKRTRSMCHIISRSWPICIWIFIDMFLGIVLNPCVVFNTVTSYVVLLADPRKDRLGSNHGRLETPTTRWTFTKLHRGFERNRVGNILAMSVQQCLACNATVSRECLENRFILFSMYSFSLSTDFKYMCFCLSVENCQVDGALQFCSSRKLTDIASNFLFTSFDFTTKQQIEFIIQVHHVQRVTNLSFAGKILILPLRLQG